ncbi:DUF4238 domain-containing protein [Brucella sp. BE17]|uniref:DUF4238 domain-containing protein n=1 Tax=Brucella sp. BE17 TaxID=3142977 RepID=UPI0031BB6970
MSGDSRSKQHHYLPKTFQKSFTVDGMGTQVFFSERGEGGLYGDPVIRNIKTTFKKKDLYTINVEGKKSDILEREYYGPIDENLSKIIPYLNEELTKNRIPVITADTSNKLKILVIEMLKRTPEFGNCESYSDVGRNTVLEAINDLSKSASDEVIRNLNNMLKDSNLTDLIGKDIIAKAKTLPMTLVDDVLKNYNIRWVRTEGKSSFILSSLCCYRIGNGGSNGLSSMSAEVWMPISPKNCLVLIRDPNKQVPLISFVNGDKVNQVNDHASTYSKQIASHSKALLEAVIKRLNK